MIKLPSQKLMRWLEMPLKRYRPPFTFITIHYFYICTLTLLGAILIFAGGEIGFADAIFQSSGSTTQSGLNTIDLNKINTYQQFLTYIFPFITGPMFMHTAVVFVRIRWFERKFKHIVEDAMEAASRPRSRNPTYSIENAERGIMPGRPIKESSAADSAAKPEGELNSGSQGDLGNTHDIKGGKNVTAESALVPRLETIADGVNPTASKELSKSRIVWNEQVLRAHREAGINSEDKDEESVTTPNSPQEFQEIRRSSTAPRNSPSDIDRITEINSPATEERLTLVESRKSRSRSRRGSVDTARYRSRSAASSVHPAVPYLSYTPTVGRNSQFFNLTDEQRNELGGIEYRALKTLFVILILYFVCIHIIGVIVLVPVVSRNPNYGQIIAANGVNRVWWAIYTSLSAFHNVGFTLTPDSLLSFQEAAFLLLFCAWLIVVGNTGFPLFLRFTIWVAWKLCPERYLAKKDELHFLLDHPRRCFTLLFPSGPTWWLFWILVGLNVADMILFLALDIQTPTVSSIPVGYRIVNALFQAVSTRTCGMASVPVGSLHPGIQVSYLVMMYISVMPLAISIRRTNVYEEYTLGIYTEETEPESNRGDEGKFILAHIRRQLEFDLWYVFLGLFLISIAEGSRIADENDYAFTAFTVLFEVISAYGTVGLSLGYPGMNTSLSGAFTTFSKMVIVAMEIRGRHRGLPYDLDRAILLANISEDTSVQQTPTTERQATETRAISGDFMPLQRSITRGSRRDPL